MGLSTEQLPTLRAAIDAETDPTFVQYRTDGATGLMAEWFNAASTFTVWKSAIDSPVVGEAFDAASLDAMTAGNADKLNNFRQWNDVVYPSRADHRSFFDGVFSPASGATTRANLYALWRRLASRGEKLFATGTGSDAAPGNLVYEGLITDQDVIRALAL